MNHLFFNKPPSLLDARSSRRTTRLTEVAALLCFLFTLGCDGCVAPVGADAGQASGGDAGQTEDAGVLDAGQKEDAGVLDAGQKEDAGVLDAGVFANAGVLDAGVLDAGVLDAGVLDAGVLADAGPPALRTLRQVPIFGDLSVENLVLDPQFSGVNWLSLNLSFTRYFSFERLVPTHTPVDQPVISLPASLSGVFITGSVKAVPSVMQAQVWLGLQTGAVDENFSSVTARLAGFIDGSAGEVLFEKEMSEPIRIMGSTTWTKFIAIVPSSRGWLDFQLEVDAAQSVRINGLQVTSMPTNKGPVRPSATSFHKRRPLSESAALGLTLRALWMEEQISLPSKKALPEVAPLPRRSTNRDDVEELPNKNAQ
ncbi:MAG: hypothetical protein GY822_01460 [Deltaproteobacteria bacterium]|nr:hypothetical protein [Deltaproteobacteria bacterium]